MAKPPERTADNLATAHRGRHRAAQDNPDLGGARPVPHPRGTVNTAHRGATTPSAAEGDWFGVLISRAGAWQTTTSALLTFRDAAADIVVTFPLTS
jgi:hypothetical protein